ncbi:3'(2'),5'-bisphosphate nucleotidase [Salinisphaera sp. PC39]
MMSAPSIPTVPMPDYDHLLEPVLALAEDAGAAILPIYRGDDFDVSHKDDDSPLTAADLAAHRVIDAGLADLAPDIPRLSEEGGEVPYATRHGWRRYWLIDPLDGTKEFIKRNGQFTVNIALIEDGEPVLGVVHAPDLGASWYGSVGHGAFKRTDGAAPEPLHTVVAHTDKPRVLVSRSHRGPDVDALLERLPDYEPVVMGSSLKFCVIAEGEADFYPRLGPTSEWDTAAGHAVLAAAGGDVVDIEGRRLRYNTKDSLLNPYFLAFGDTSHDWLKYLPEEE